MLDETFQEFYHSFKLYKADAKTLDFVKDNEAEKIPEYNDSWFDTLTEEYYDIIESSDDKLEMLSSKDTLEQVISDKETKFASEGQLNMEMKTIADSIYNFDTKSSKLNAVCEISARLEGKFSSISEC